MQDDSGSWPNKRRYPRIVIPHEKADLHTIIGINAQIPSGEKVPVLDLSYNGAAILKVPHREIEKIGTELPLQFFFEGHLLKPVKTEVVRTSDSAVGLRFAAMPPETRVDFDKMMNDKMLGLNTHRVRTDLLNSKDRRYNLTHWYHGPKDTNIFIWMIEDQMVKFMIEVDYQMIDFEKGEMQFAQTLPETEFFRDGYSGYAEVRASSNVSFSQTDLMKRAINILSHIPKKGAVIDSVIDLLIKRVKS